MIENLVASSCYIGSGQNGVLPGRSSSQNRGGLAPQRLPALPGHGRVVAVELTDPD